MQLLGRSKTKMKKSDGLKMDGQKRSGKKFQSTRYAAAGNITSMKTRLKDARKNLMASKELVKFAVEKATWKSKEKERIHEALRELEMEKRTRR
ncbi:hypothetical protein AKJ16_DCAP10858 [Drosera capensis]